MISFVPDTLVFFKDLSNQKLPFRDHSFNLNDFIRSLRAELKSWRRVFWRLWGMVHPLYCSLCSSHFPVYLNEFCRFHPQVRCFS